MFFVYYMFFWVVIWKELKIKTPEMEECFKGEKEFLKPYFEDLENHENFEIVSEGFYDKQLIHKSKGYTIVYENIGYDRYTIRCNGEFIQSLDCTFDNTSLVNLFVDKCQDVVLKHKLSRINCQTNIE